MGHLNTPRLLTRVTTGSSKQDGLPDLHGDGAVIVIERPA